MDYITWQIVVLMMGALVTVLTFLSTILKKPTKPNSTVETDFSSHQIKFETHKATVEQQIAEIKTDIQNVKQEIKDRDEKTIKSIEKLESKIEKFTDIIVDHIRKN
jgi:peptidoglycan hydrolase CwlO-like protein